jgi:hypothetical protein
MELKVKPTEIGPGTWFWAHTKAKLATTEATKREYQEFIDFIIKNFPCLTCRTHSQEFIKLNPLVNFWNLRNTQGEEIGCFKHSWMWHNHANAVTGKKPLDFETAYNMYYGAGYTVCTSGCDGGHEAPERARNWSHGQQHVTVKSPNVTLRPQSEGPKPRIRPYNA